MKITNICVNIFPISYIKNGLNLFAFSIYRVNKNEKVDSLKISINDILFDIKTLFKKGIKLITYKNYSYYFNVYKLNIPYSKIKDFPIQNPIYLLINNNKLPIVYNLFNLKKGKGKNSKLAFENNFVFYFRQGKRNSLNLTIREKLKTDSFKYQFKINLAWFISKLVIVKNKVLIFEKESYKYEESGSVVFEELMKKGFKNIYFVIDKDSIYIDRIPKIYLKDIIYKYTFKHYLYFFLKKTLIGTEMPTHVVDLRIANKKVNN